MRTSTFARAGAIVTASALAVSLSSGPVSAAESDSTTGRVAGATPTAVVLGTGSGVGAAGTITALQLNSGVITQRETTQLAGTVAGYGVPLGTEVQTDVTVNGTYRGRVTLYPGNGDGGVEIPRVWGSGRVQVGPTYFADGTVDQNRSNVVYARKLVTTTRSDGYALKVNRRNSKVTFRARNVKIIDPASGQFKSLRRVKLQRSKGGKWRTIKTIRLNSSGNGKYTKTGKTKYRYRLYSQQTSKQTQFRTIRTGRI